MKLAALIFFVSLATPAPAADEPGAAAPAGAGQDEPAAKEKAKVTIRVVSAKEGSDANDEKIDGRLAQKLRTTLKQLNLFKKPDLALLETRAASVAQGEAVEASASSHVAVATCKSASADAGVVVGVEIFTEAKDPKTKKPVRKLKFAGTAKLKDGDEVQPFNVQTSDGLRLFVVGAEREAPPKEAPPPPPPPPARKRETPKE